LFYQLWDHPGVVSGFPVARPDVLAEYATREVSVVEVSEILRLRCEISLAVKTGAVVGVAKYIGGEDLQGITARQPRMLGQINLAHTSRPENAHDPIASERLSRTQRHGLDTTNNGRRAMADSWQPFRRPSSSGVGDHDRFGAVTYRGPVGWVPIGGWVLIYERREGKLSTMHIIWRRLSRSGICRYVR
jgi:hypothetical protein